MATSVPQGDPSLSQNAGNAALQWQGRTARMPQFTGLADADVAAGSLPNPTAPPAAPTAAPAFGAGAPQPAPEYEGPTPAPAQPTTRLAQIRPDGDANDAREQQQAVQRATQAPHPLTGAPAPALGQGMNLYQPQPPQGYQRFQHFLRPNSGGGYGGAASGGAVNAGSNPGLAGGPAGNPAPPPSGASSNFAAPPADSGDDASGNPLRLY